MQPFKDKQTVTADWTPVAAQIDGVRLKRLVTMEDERGEVCEMFRHAWGVSDAPLVYAYHASIRPGMIKGWNKHMRQDDRIFTVLGFMRWALFDDRPESPTYKLLQVFTVGERNRALFVIPSGVYHAVMNVGNSDAYFVNMPTRTYDHAEPDKLRLPVKNDVIPFAFETTYG